MEALGFKIFYQGGHGLAPRTAKGISVVSGCCRIVRRCSHKERIGSLRSARASFAGDSDEEHPQRAQFEDLSAAKDESSVNIMKASSKVDEETDNNSELELYRRSDFIAKQVISVSEAMTIGFVSQLWVDLRKWQVKAVELKPNLLFGEVEGVFLDDVLKVGDVILVRGEQVLEGDLHLPSFDGIVGCELITEDGVSLGKIRDYVFNVEDGSLVYFEYDYLGVSLLPSSMITTYCLMADEVIEPFSSEMLLVRQGAQNRARRLTKGLFHFFGGGKRQGRRGSPSRYRRRRASFDGERFEEETVMSKTQQTVLSYSPRELDSRRKPTFLLYKVWTRKTSGTGQWNTQAGVCYV